MKTKFNGHYIKRISFYVGIIAFIAYLIITLVMWIIDLNKEADNLVNNTKAELAPFIQWYEEDSTKELESIQNLTQESFKELNVNVLVHQNLQDIQKTIDKIEILSNFIFLPFYKDEKNENNMRIYTKGLRAISLKIQMINILLSKERDFNPNQTYFILHDKERYQDYQNFLGFLESRIQNDFLNPKKLEKASLDKIASYYPHIISFYYATNALFLFDSKHNTCSIDKKNIQKTLARCAFIEDKIRIFSDLFDEKLTQSTQDDEAKKEAYRKAFEASIATLKPIRDSVSIVISNLKECQ